MKRQHLYSPIGSVSVLSLPPPQLELIDVCVGLSTYLR